MKACEDNPRLSMEYDLVFTVLNVTLHAVTALSAGFLNALVMLTFFKTPSLQTPSRILVCSLALSDFLMGTLVQVVAIIHFVAKIQNYGQAIVCMTWMFNTRLGYSLGLISLLTLAVISIDRCLAIVIKTSYRYVVTKKRTALLALCIWVLTSAVITTTVQVLHPKQFDILSIFTAMSLLTITVSCSIAFHSLKRLSVQVAGQQSSSSQQQSPSDFNVFKYRRSLVTMIIVLAIILLLYLPFLISTSIIGNFSSNDNLRMIVIFDFLVTVSCIASPIVYIWRMKDLRRASKNLLGLS